MSNDKFPMASTLTPLLEEAKEKGLLLYNKCRKRTYTAQEVQDDINNKGTLDMGSSYWKLIPSSEVK